MKLCMSVFTTGALAAACLVAACWAGGGARAASVPAPEECDVPQSLVESDTDLPRATAEAKERHRLDISVIGTGSSALAGPDGARFAYPARLDEALKARLPGVDIEVTTHVQPRATTATMVEGLEKSCPMTSRRC